MSKNNYILKIATVTLILIIIPAFFSACSVIDTSQGHAETTTEPETPESSCLEISELMAHNTIGIRNSEGLRFGWIEIHNFTAQTVSTDGYALRYGVNRYDLPVIDIEPNEYCVYFAAGIGIGSTNLPFTLSDSGAVELIFEGKVAQKVKYSNPTPDFSYSVESSSETKLPTPYGDTPAAADNIVISEVFANSRFTLTDGKFASWLEIFNNGDNAVNLADYYLSNDPERPYCQRVSEQTLAPGAYFVVNAVNSLITLPPSGATLVITRCDGVVSDTFTYGQTETDMSLVRSGASTHNMLPTPGAPNTEESARAYISSVAGRSGLVINEVISSNSSAAKAPDGGYYDTIELFNNSDESLNLSEYYLSDKRLKLTKWQLPEVILGAGKYFVVYATGSDTASGDSYSTIGISSSGEELYLSRADGYVQDAIEIPAIPVNRSWGRYGDGFVYFPTVSIGKANPAGGYPSISSLPAASISSGVYYEPQAVTLSAGDGGTIYYTLDGSKPDTGSRKYSGEVINVTETCAIRALCVNGDHIPSAVATFNYFVNEPEYKLDVIKLTLAPDDFSYLYSHFLTRTEKEISVAYYSEGKELFSTNCGLLLSGKSSRYFEKKSFRLKFRSKYGASDLDYKVFDNLDLDEFDSLVLRSGSGGSASYRMFFNDEFATSIVGDSDYIDELLVQAYKPVNVYVNDEYYGIYYIREKINEEFVASHTGVSPESVSIVFGMSDLEHGTSYQGWKELWEFICNSDLTVKQNYDYVASNISLESAADFYIMQAWSGNMDSGNVRVYKSSEGDGLWRFIFFDLDMTFEKGRSKYGLGTVASMIGSYTTKHTATMSSYNALIYKLLENDEFRALFFSRLKHICENELSGESLGAKLTLMHDELMPDMELSIARWKGKGNDRLPYHSSVTQWENVLADLRTHWFCETRTNNLIYEFIDVVKLSDDEVIQYLGSEYLAEQNK